MNAEEQLMVHQLLGRIVYFHCLFIEPNAQTTELPSGLHPDECCRHTEQDPGAPFYGPDLATTAWAVLPELSRTMTAASRPNAEALDCCAACRVRDASTAIAHAWIAVESAAYGRVALSTATTRGWAQLAGLRLSTAFARQYPTQCACLRTEPDSRPAAPPTPDDLPITSELLALWADPTCASAPVVSWLNHCSTLADVGQVIQRRRTGA